MTASRIAELEAALRSAQAFQTKLSGLASRAHYEHEELEDKEAFNRFGATVAQWKYDGTFASYRDEFAAALSAPAAPEAQPTSVEAGRKAEQAAIDTLWTHRNPQSNETLAQFRERDPIGFEEFEAVGAFVARAVVAALIPTPPPTSEPEIATGEAVAVKSLDWSATAWNHRAADLYVIEDMGSDWTADRFWLAVHGILNDTRLGKFAALDEAKAAAQADYEARIRSALAAPPEPVQRQAASVGWKLVPVEPTPQMRAAGQGWSHPRGVWKAMLAASPPPAASGVEEVAHPDAFQQFKDGKWVESSHFVAFGFGDKMADGVRTLYTAPPAPTDALKVAEESERRGLIKARALADLYADTPVGSDFNDSAEGFAAGFDYRTGGCDNASAIVSAIQMVLDDEPLPESYASALAAIRAKEEGHG